MTESGFLADVYGLCDKSAVSYHHCCDSRFCRGRKGLPDLILIGMNGILFREIKTRNDRVSPDQTAMLWLFAASGADAKVWTEDDLASGKVAQEIAAIS